MINNQKKVNWFEEELDDFYGDDNNGLIYGVYSYDDNEEIYDIAWFKTEEEQENYLMEEVC